MEVDPLLKDLSEKKQSFRRSVVSLASELKDVRSRLASQEESIAKEMVNRKMAETKARTLEEEIGILHRCLEERDGQLQASTSTAEQVPMAFGSIGIWVFHEDALQVVKVQSME